MRTHLVILTLVSILTMSTATLADDLAGKSDSSIVLPAQLQDTSFQTVVLFKSGGKLIGRIVEDVPGKTITIEQADGSRFTACYKEIDRISRVGEYETRQQEILSTPVPRVRPRMNFRVSLAPMGGEVTREAFGLAVSVGKELHPQLFVGVGGGAEYYNNEKFGFVPITVEAQYFMTNKRIAPLLIARAGYALGWAKGVSDKFLGGLRFELGAGGLWSEGARGGFFATLGVAWQQVDGLHPLADDHKETVRIDLGGVF